MPSVKTQSVTDALVEMLRANGLEQSVLDVQVEEVWPQVMGDVVNRLTRSVEVTACFMCASVPPHSRHSSSRTGSSWCAN